MTQSMTGFASLMTHINLDAQSKITLIMHVKTLNSRYFEINCKLPMFLSTMEIDIHRIAKQKIERGYVSVQIKVQHDDLQHAVMPNKHLIHEYTAAIDQIKKMCKINEPVSLATLLALPNVVHVEESTLSAPLQEKIMKQIDLLFAELVKNRSAEGSMLQKDIEQSMKFFVQHLGRVEKKSAVLFKEKKKKLESIVKKLEGVDTVTMTLEQSMLVSSKASLLLELEKMDIHEEVVRAAMHAKNIIKICKSSEAVKGKKIDFTLQELHREINTIASKSSSGDIATLVIDMKSNIEKAREQAQNVL